MDAIAPSPVSRETPVRLHLVKTSRSSLRIRIGSKDLTNEDDEDLALMHYLWEIIGNSADTTSGQASPSSSNRNPARPPARSP
ncbi:hypothetical protein [Streptomyces chartreusis]|uniref:hypothetical protein n=1 Tax=Streptomyces chartreusis TaxID=1969 RepID=UPI002E815871|nr:hypothetical protein [Streptomyces chartreusis]WUB20659.1 hypothetical protein OG997_29865 [Streptomyces chartreusis]